MEREVSFDADDIIVSKTDLKGRITYVNRLFMDVSGYDESELIGKPHSVIRHAEMPRAIFKLLWSHLLDETEVFGYVKNRCREDGQFYWVFAHMTPSRDAAGRVTGYHSVRRVPDRRVLDGTIIPLYRELRRIEEAAPDRRTGLERSFSHLTSAIQNSEVAYDEWIFSR